MNLDDLTRRSLSPSRSNKPTLSDLQDLENLSDPDRSHPPSEASDSEWVSPFTVLPPLPALRKNRHLQRSPEERLHQRNSSSAYYAAAWGSPYATPSPSRSPPSAAKDHQSREFQVASPLSSRHTRFQSIAVPKRSASELDQGVTAEGPASRPRANSWDRLKTLSERFNWLSDTDVSGSDGEGRAGKTPTRKSYLTAAQARQAKAAGKSATRLHQAHESVSTITPDTFAEHDEALPNHLAPANMEQVSPEPVEARPDSIPTDKPLPNLPQQPSSTAAVTVESRPSPELFRRPSMPTSQSFQRPKKKVPWKGKTCVIALPLTDRESAGLPPLLSAEETKSRMQKWVDLGYDVRGFSIGDTHDAAFIASSQSRALYPDPADVIAERKLGRLYVHIPDQSEWDAWVEYLKEEKLRALGVTPSNSEAPQSSQSPFSSSMSRVSSTFPSIAPSPPISALSNNGNQIRIGSATFSPPVSHPSQAGSHVASPIPGMHAAMHGYKGSVAFPRMTSPFDYPVSQPNAFGQSMRQTPSGMGIRQFSPPQMQQVPSLSQILSPMLPAVPTIPSNDSGRGAIPNTSMENIRQQQQRQQQIHAHMLQHQHQRQQSLFPQPAKSAELPRTPNVLESPSRTTPEIMHPTPRSHRHNLSAALQKGVDDAEAARSSKSSQILSEKLQIMQNSVQDEPTALVVEEEDEAEDHDQEELPVLQRPETLGQVEDASDIETNPSMAASPLLMDDKNPFANIPTLKDTLKEQSLGHTSANSLSKFNVAAPEFSPAKAPSNAGFSFNPVAAQAFVPTHSANPSLSRLTHDSRAPSLSKFNVEAPSFTPSFMKQATPQDSVASTPVKKPTPAKETPAEKSMFTFSSPFNVEAPEFKPAQAFSFNAPEFVPSQAFSFESPGVAPIFESHHASSGSIFGNVTIDSSSKVNRRGPKVLPIVAPKSRETTPMEGTDVDEEGRLRAPSDRQKRARRVDDDGDQAPQFADSAPFDHAEGLAAKDKNEAQNVTEESLPEDIAKNSNTNIDEKSELAKTSAGVFTPPTKAEDSITHGGDGLKSVDLAAGDSNEESVVDAIEVIEEVSSESPSSASNSEGEGEDEDEVVVEEELSSSAEGSQVELPPQHQQPPASKATSTMSALAKPFELITPALPSPKKIGLGASRFATSSPPPKLSAGLRASRFAPSPPASPPRRSPSPPVNHTTALPQDMYEYVNPKDLDLTQSKPVRVSTSNDHTPKLPPHMQFQDTPELVKSIEKSIRSDGNAGHSRPISDSTPVDGPSYEEIDAVMKQFEDNPDLGIERNETPVKSTPLIDMRLPPNLRSDAPSPSPRRLQEGFRQSSPQRRADFGLGIHKLNDSIGVISDWGNDYSPQQEHKLHQRAGFFDGHVNGIVDSIIESRLEPFERHLQTIQHSIALLADKTNDRSRRSVSTGHRESDADDEDDLDDLEGHSQSYRSRSPSRRDRKADRIRNAVIDAMSSYQPSIEQPAVDMSEIHAALDEMRQLSRQAREPQPLPDLKSMIEEAISSHPRVKSIRVDDDDVEAQQEASALKLGVLEKSLKAAEQRAEQEASIRQQAEADMQALNRKLLDAQDVASRLREAHEMAQQNQNALLQEQEVSRIREQKLMDAEEKNAKLEILADEYRRTVEDLRDQVGDEKSRYQDLEFTLHVIKAKHSERDESRQALRGQIDRLQVRIAQVVDDMSHEEAEWRKREHELVVANQKTQAALDHEIRHREKVENQRNGLEKEYQEMQRFKNMHEHSQVEIVRLQSEIGQLRQENKAHQDANFQLDRELSNANGVTESEVAKATAQLQSNLDAAKWTIDNLKTDSEGQIKRLQARLDNAELDLEDQKAKHDSIVNDMTETRNQAVHEADEKRENALQEQRATHDKKLNDLRERHTRALHNSSDDKHRLEYQLNEKIEFGQEKIKHLESKVSDLEDRLEVTKSAARAAVQAATAKGIDLPTPAPSVVASPPQRAVSASIPLTKGTDLPERISPQALRESIMVLQDQLQNREMKIEELQQELSAIDKTAPTKVKERENEISLLRELLAVRADDLAELVSTLSKPDFNRERARDAAIRLRANTQMEQQLKERAHAIGQMSLPSISSITNLAASPRSLPMAAAAAWGNWRKARDFSTNALNNLTAAVGEQTPSKSNNSSPSSILAGIMTPPSTSQRTPPGENRSQSPTTMRPLSAVPLSRKNTAPIGPARPLRGYSSQPRSLASRQADQRRDSVESSSREDDNGADSPQTPTFNRGIGSSGKELEFADDVDEDASPFDSSTHEQEESVSPPSRIHATGLAESNGDEA